MIKPYPTDTGQILVTDLDLLPICTLKKMKSADGSWEMIEGRAFIGKPYKYSPASRSVETITNKLTGFVRECEIVLVYDDRGRFAMLPTELLDFNPASQ